MLLLVSVALGAALIWILIRLGKVNVAATLRQTESVRPYDFLVLAGLNALLVGLSTVKWRSVDAALRRDSDAVPSRIAAYSMSSLGMALGLLLPVQLGMTAARTVGTHVYGRTLKRGTGGTLFEQSFDLLTVLLLASASAITWLCRGGALLWAICAIAIIGASLVATRPLLWLFRRILDFAARIIAGKFGGRLSRYPEHFLTRSYRGLAEIRHSGLVWAGLARRLLMLSMARFGVIVLMARQTASMTGAHITLWQMGAATPFTAISNLVAVTPGALGLNELTSVAALHAFGVPLSVVSRWALANRILGTASCFLIAAFALGVLGAERTLTFAATGSRRTINNSILSSTSAQKEP